MADKYISAEQAYAYLRSVLYETATNNAGINDDFASACEEIADNRLKIWLDDIPAADVVERKKGTWIDDDGLYVCSSCNKLWAHWWDNAMPPERLYKEMKYCPRCGAEMREEEKSNGTI